MNKQVFISYRHEDATPMAHLLKTKLQEKGISVFLDTTSLKSGRFDQQIIDSIKNAVDFIVILSEKSLCPNKDGVYWLEKEVSIAFEHNKHIIPIIMPNFKWPSVLSQTMSDLKKEQGIVVHNQYMDSAISKCIGFLDCYEEKSITPKHWMILALLTLIVGMALYTSVNMFSSSKATPSSLEYSNDIPTDEETIDRLLHPNWETYRSKSYKYRIDIPDTFEKDTQSDDDDIIYTSIDGKANLRISAQSFEKNIPEDYLYSNYIKKYSDNLDEYHYGNLKEEHWYTSFVRLEKTCRYRKVLITTDHTIAKYDFVYSCELEEIYGDIDSENNYFNHLEDSFRIDRK